MKLIVISSHASIPNEHKIIASLFEEGLEQFQVDKPEFSKEQVKEYIQKIPSQYQSQVVSHADYPKYHSIEELEKHTTSKDAFLSPIFNSISKPGHKGKFSHRSHTSLPGTKGFSQINPELIPAVRGKNIIALGGVDEEKVDLVRIVGFKGVAVVGAIWNSKDPLQSFKRIKAKCQKQDLAH